MTDQRKRMPNMERKGKEKKRASSTSHPQKFQQVKALGYASESAALKDKDIESSAELDAACKTLTQEERNHAIMEDFVDYRADGGLLASARYYTSIQNEVPKFRRYDKNLEGGIPNPFEDKQNGISEEDEENHCIERALDAGNERPTSHRGDCECEECAVHNARQPIDALTPEAKYVFNKMEDIMYRLRATSTHPAVKDHVFDAYGKYYGAMYNVSAEKMDALHVVYHDDCECQVCQDYAAEGQNRVVSVKPPIVMKPSVKIAIAQKANVGTVGDFDDLPGRI